MLPLYMLTRSINACQLSLQACPLAPGSHVAATAAAMEASQIGSEYGRCARCGGGALTGGAFAGGAFARGPAQLAASGAEHVGGAVGAGETSEAASASDADFVAALKRAFPDRCAGPRAKALPVKAPPPHLVHLAPPAGAPSAAAMADAVEKKLEMSLDDIVSGNFRAERAGPQAQAERGGFKSERGASRGPAAGRGPGKRSWAGAAYADAPAFRGAIGPSGDRSSRARAAPVRAAPRGLRGWNDGSGNAGL
ncbi:unnamed protein product [Prorocentrum cordatum]|uniref:RNA helicase n=1 Tax=Prorocentrum cordatum TaxID=2364126 RepID=A0ABN9T2N8_9DINO|nr:unnamed protein product [Polarella glacialis]